LKTHTRAPGKEEKEPYLLKVHGGPPRGEARGDWSCQGAEGGATENGDYEGAEKIGPARGGSGGGVPGRRLLKYGRRHCKVRMRGGEEKSMIDV